MAKKKKEKDKAKAAKGLEMPKTVGGAKVPKGLRNTGDMISSIVTSPMARELVADALIAIAGVLAGNKKSREAVAAGAREIGQTATGAVAEVVAETARRILPSAMTGEDGKDAPKTPGRRGPQGAGASRAMGASRKRKTPERPNEG